MQTLFIYRLYPGENPKGRPPYYSKELALKSFIAAYRRVGQKKKLILAVDAADLPDNYSAIIGRQADSVLYLGGIGNTAGYLQVLNMIESENASDIFYVSEDDYLYKPDALAEFVTAMNSLPGVDYATLYDHPDRYTRNDNQAPFGGDKIYVSGRYHWRTVESTCMSFGGRISSMKKDARIHRRLTRNRKYPKDRQIWHKKLGIGWYFWRFPKRRLIAPMPSLATHLEAAFLAPAVDWNSLAEQVHATFENA